MKKQILTAIAATITLGLSSANAIEMTKGTSSLQCDGKFSLSQHFDGIASNTDAIDTTATSRAYKRFADNQTTVIGSATLGVAANGAAAVVDVASETVNFTTEQIENLVSLIPGGIEQIAEGDVAGLVGMVAHKGSKAIHISFRAVGGVTHVVFNELVPSVGDSTLGASATFLRNQGKGWSWAAEVLDGTNLVLNRVSRAGAQIILVPVLTGIVLTNEVACAIDGLANGVQQGLKKAGANFVATVKKNEKAGSYQRDDNDKRNEEGR